MKTTRINLTTVTKRVSILGEDFALVTFDVNGEKKVRHSSLHIH